MVGAVTVGATMVEAKAVVAASMAVPEGWEVRVRSVVPDNQRC